jgi:hypothetical protein
MRAHVAHDDGLTGGSGGGHCGGSLHITRTDTAGEPAANLLHVAAALRLPDARGRDPVESLCEHLTAKELLLVLDNCEHVLGESANLARGLLAACPGVRILATSREPLCASAERSRGRWSPCRFRSPRGAGTRSNTSTPRRSSCSRTGPHRHGPASTSTCTQSQTSARASTESPWPSSWPPPMPGCSPWANSPGCWRSSPSSSRGRPRPLTQAAMDR